MAVQIGAKPDAAFDDPLGMLKDCHRRIESFLRVLCLAVLRRPEGPLTAEERDALEAALAYFRTGGERHNRDEEDSLFPRLREAVSAADLEIIRGLETEHGEAGELHATAERLYRGWIALGSLGSEDRQALLAATDRLQRLYAGHIQVEESVVFPRAAAMLDAQAIAAIGSEFRERRTLPRR